MTIAETVLLALGFQGVTVPDVASIAAMRFRCCPEALSGVDPDPFLPMLPAVAASAAGFGLQYDVEFRDSGGVLVRTSRRQMHVDALPGQALSFAQVRVHAPGSPAERGGAGFRVTFDAAGGVGVDPGEPLFEVTFTADCRTATTTGVSESAAAAAAVAELAAWPTITREGTELRWTRPAAAGGRIDLFDLAGRLVRTLPVRPGDTMRTWDGRGSDGRAMAAGVYFARLSGSAPRSAARIVRMP
jgi:hypothetical protein